MHWIPLTAIDQIEQIKQHSFEVPCLLFKHSTRCNISAIAKFRLEDDWNFEPQEMEAYFLDLLLFRPVSSLAAEQFQVHHESPQVLLLVDGECIFDASHLDISVQEIREALKAGSLFSNR